MMAAMSSPACPAMRRARGLANTRSPVAAEAGAGAGAAASGAGGGGAAGGGKSDALLYGGLRQIRVPRYRALLLRQSFPELRDLLDRAAALFPQLGGVWSEQQKRWSFPSGATYGFGFCAPAVKAAVAIP